jgi:hypothetical protein
LFRSFVFVSNVLIKSDQQGKNTYSSLENTLIAPIGFRGLLNFGLRGIRVHDAILAGNLIAIALSVVALDALVLVELGLEECLERLELGVLRVAGRVGRLGEVALEALDTIFDGGITDLCLGDVLLELVLGGAIGAAQGALVELADEIDVGSQGLDVVAQTLDVAEKIVLGEDGR